MQGVPCRWGLELLSVLIEKGSVGQGSWVAKLSACLSAYFPDSRRSLLLPLFSSQARADILAVAGKSWP